MSMYGLVTLVVAKECESLTQWTRFPWPMSLLARAQRLVHDDVPSNTRCTNFPTKEW